MLTRLRGITARGIVFTVLGAILGSLLGTIFGFIWGTIFTFIIIFGIFYVVTDREIHSDEPTSQTNV